MSEKAIAKLIASYLAIGGHRAMAIAPKAQDHWWTGNWPSAELAEEKALERCQIAFGEPCELVALDEAPTPSGPARAPRDMPRVNYSGDFDPAQIPGVRALIGVRADVVGYLQAPEPKAVALHPRGVVSIVSGAATQRRAEIDALKACNKDKSTGEGDQSCFVYAIGAKVVLPKRATKSVSRP